MEIFRFCFALFPFWCYRFLSILQKLWTYWFFCMFGFVIGYLFSIIKGRKYEKIGIWILSLINYQDSSESSKVCMTFSFLKGFQYRNPRYRQDFHWSKWCSIISDHDEWSVESEHEVILTHHKAYAWSQEHPNRPVLSVPQATVPKFVHEYNLQSGSKNHFQGWTRRY